MGFFNRTIEDAEALVRLGKWDDALTIIRTHRIDDAHIHTHLDTLIWMVQGYQAEIVELERLLSEPSKDMTKINKRFKHLKNNLYYITKAIKNLVRDGKIELE